MARGGVTAGETEEFQLNLTAMINVVFLLVIFFVVNLRFPQEEGSLSANLPKAGRAVAGANVPKIDKVVIGIDYPNRQVRVIVNNQPVGGMTQLATKLFLLQRQIPDAEVTLDVKPDVPYRYVVEAFNLCARNKFTKVAFAQPPATP